MHLVSGPLLCRETTHQGRVTLVMVVLMLGSSTLVPSDCLWSRAQLVALFPASYHFQLSFLQFRMVLTSFCQDLCLFSPQQCCSTFSRRITSPICGSAFYITLFMFYQAKMSLKWRHVSGALLCFPAQTVHIFSYIYILWLVMLRLMQSGVGGEPSWRKSGI